MDRNKKIYKKNNLSALARHIEVSTATLHNWKRGKHKDKKSGHKGTINKFNLILKGWEAECAEKA